MTKVAQDKSKAQIHKDRTAIVYREFGELEGKTVAQVRALLPEETEQFGWEYEWAGGGFYPWCIIFTDGTVAIPSCDPEGNDAGFMFLADSDTK